MTTKAQLLKVIRRNCCSCMGDQPTLVEGCTSPECEMFPFRMGKDPNRSKKGFASRGKVGSKTPSTRKEVNQISTKSPLNVGKAK